MEIAQKVNVATWSAFVLGLLVITLAYLSATFQGKSSLIPSRGFSRAVDVGTAIMYVALLITPAVPILYHRERHNLNGYDVSAAGAQWASYIALPIAISLWESPRHAGWGGVLLGFSVTSLLASAFLKHKAHQKRDKPQ